jgi:hypothetical protein
VSSLFCPTPVQHSNVWDYKFNDLKKTSVLTVLQQHPKHVRVKPKRPDLENMYTPSWSTHFHSC